MDEEVVIFPDFNLYLCMPVAQVLTIKLYI